MTRKMMIDLYKELDEIRIGFDGAETRHWDSVKGDMSDLSTRGFLYNRDEAPMEMEQLAKVLEIAKAKQTYFVVMPEIAAMKRGVFVCFLQQGLFQTAEKVIPSVTRNLRRNFSYLQEEEEAIKLDVALQELHKKLANYQLEAYNSTHLIDASRHLRSAIREDGNIIENKRPIRGYMADVFELRQAEALCSAISCMQLTLY